MLKSTSRSKDGHNSTLGHDMHVGSLVACVPVKMYMNDVRDNVYSHARSLAIVLVYVNV